MTGTFVELPEFLLTKINEESQKTGKKKKFIYKDALEKYYGVK